PTIFFNQNNGYAISVPIDRHMNSETIAQKALAYGMPSVRVDGNDCFGVFFETRKAIEYAREGNGPTRIEAVTWRKGAHTTADDPSKYRSEESGKNIIDPIVRLQRFMENKGFWDIEMIQTIQSDIEKEVDDAIKGMES